MTNDGGTPPQVRTFPAPERAMPVETNRLQTSVGMTAVRPGAPHTALRTQPPWPSCVCTSLPRLNRSRCMTWHGGRRHE
jgi:hypothetical protein